MRVPGVGSTFRGSLHVEQAIPAGATLQLVGYAAYLIPAFLVVTGWNYFWCRDVDAAGTKVTGGALLFACTSAFLSSILGTISVSGKPFRSGGYVGDWVSGEMAVTDPVISQWVEENAHYLHWVAPALGAALVVVVGKWLAARAAKMRPRVIDLAHEEPKA